MSKLSMRSFERATVKVVTADGIHYEIKLRPNTGLIEVRQEAIPITSSFGGWMEIAPGEQFARIELDGALVRALRRDASQAFRPRAADFNHVAP